MLSFLKQTYLVTSCMARVAVLLCLYLLLLFLTANGFYLTNK